MANGKSASDSIIKDTSGSYAVKAEVHSVLNTKPLFAYYSVHNTTRLMLIIKCDWVQLIFQTLYIETSPQPFPSVRATCRRMATSRSWWTVI
jgi:hypothetical protein